MRREKRSLPGSRTHSKIDPLALRRRRKDGSYRYDGSGKALPSLRYEFCRDKITGTYTGSMPRRIATFRSRLTDRIDLEAKLEQSIQNEDYEKAAIYRDYLRALERGAVADGSDAGTGAENA